MIVAGALALFLGAPPAREERTYTRSLDALVQPLVDAGVAPGLVVGALVDGAVLVRGYGTTGRGADTGVPDGETVFEIGSITKVFAGLLLADAVERGVAALDQPLRELLPDRVPVPTYGPREIRLVHLATHTSGLPRMPDGLSQPYVVFDERRLALFLADFELASSPGEASTYSNLGAGLLGYALGLTLHEDFDTMVQERIAGPLGLRETRVALTDSMRARLAVGHDADGRLRPALRLPPALQAASALHSTANDLLRFAAANLSPESTPLAAAIRASHAVQFDFDDECDGIALFWGRQQRGETLEHSGTTLGYWSFLGLHPERHVAVVVLANTSSGRIGDLARSVFALFLGEAAPRVPVRMPLTLERTELERFAGAYALPNGSEIRIHLGKAGLFARIPNEPVARLFASSERDFFLRMFEATISFETDTDGEPRVLVLRRDGEVVRAARR